MGDPRDLSLEQKAMQGVELTPEERRAMWLSISDISAEEFDAGQAWREARQAHVPQPGTMAPDFELDVLDRVRKRTGEKVRLVDLRGQIVGLAFGSFT